MNKFILVYLILFCGFVQANSEVDVLSSSWSEVAPEVDGFISEREWSNASVIILSGFDRLYVMNNLSHLFFLYVVLDGSRSYDDSALFLDPDGDGFYNRVYGDNWVFMVFPLQGGVVGDGGGIYCGNSMFGVSDTNCGTYFKKVVPEGKVAYSRSSTGIVSEVVIPLDNYREDSVFFWLLYGSPSPVCFPESLQCSRHPVFAELMLAEGSDNVSQVFTRGDSIGLLDYYDIRPITAN